MLLVALFAAIAGWAQDPPGDARPGPLSELARPDWASRPPWNDGLSEIAEYQARITVDGAVQDRRVVLITGQEDFSRESLARASWPYGARPVVEAMRQRMIIKPAGAENDGMSSADLWAERSTSGRILRLLVAQVASRGALVRDFDFSSLTPGERYVSPRDGEGTGTRSVDFPQEAIFEEQLPLVLRGLRLEDGKSAWCSLMTSVSDGTCQRPTPALAIVSVAREKSPPRLPMRSWQGDPPWRVTVEAGDGRRIECLIASDPARTLLSLEHSNGSGLALSALRRGVPAE